MKLPPPLNYLWKGWMAFSNVLGMIMSKVILTVMWLAVFSIYGVILKIVMLFKPKKKSDTYWVNPPKKIENDLRHQF